MVKDRAVMWKENQQLLVILPKITRN
jgi:hypothetical protein